MVARSVLVRTFIGTGATLLSLTFVYAETQSANVSVQPTAMAASTANDAEHPDGKELFNREWLPNDSRSHGGDGLGPVFNDSSCVACHNQGGSGGGGPASKNIDIITAFVNPAQMQQVQQQAAPNSITGLIVSSLIQAVASNHGTRILSQPSQNSEFTINISADPPQQAHATEQAPPIDGSGSNAQPSQASANSNAQAQPAQNVPNATATVAVASNSSAAATAASPATRNGAAIEQKPADKLAEIRKQKAELAKIHPAFASARSVVLHRFSTNDKYEAWRNKLFGLTNFDDPFGAPNREAVEVNATIQSGSQTATASASLAEISSVEIQVVSDVSSEQQMQQLKLQAQMGQIKGLRGQVGNFAFVHSPRNPTALFGAGLIDQIPDRVLLEQAQRQFKDFPEIQGRVAKMKDGKIGRFGWKDQKTSLYEFAMTACAVELGLDVPDQPQSGLPLDPKYKPKGHDMDQAECDALVAYLRNLPAPVQRKAASPQEAEMLSAGEKHFAAVGCANCHVKQLGAVSGIYSDLLLHDMGQDLGDSGDYNVFVPDTPEEQQADDPVPSLVQQSQQRNDPNAHVNPPTKADREKTIGAMRQEWRTPPLWGVRDSGPYLHDGRAETLEQAIAFHGGEAVSSAKRFFMLKPDERAELIAFLKSLIAPEQDQLALAK